MGVPQEPPHTHTHIHSRKLQHLVSHDSPGFEMRRQHLDSVDSAAGSCWVKTKSLFVKLGQRGKGETREDLAGAWRGTAPGMRPHPTALPSAGPSRASKGPLREVP